MLLNFYHHNRQAFLVLHRLAFAGVCALLLAGLGACALLDREAPLPVEVLYLTTRAEAESSARGQLFGSGRGTLQAGVIKKTFSQASALTENAGEPPNPLLKSLAIDASDVERETLSMPELLASLQQYPRQEAIIYIHGYKRTFNEAIEVGARLRFELNFQGPVIVFSWPSLDSYSGYMADAVNLEWSEPELLALVRRINQSLPGYRLNFVAHSMGNRALVQVLMAIARHPQSEPTINLGQVVMIAPDIDRTIFLQQYSRQLTQLDARYTLYVSSEDFPLMASAIFNAYPRIGDSRELVPLVPGMETVDASSVISMATGHTYYRKNELALHDLYQLLVEGKGARSRTTLSEVSSAQGSYWRLTESPD